MNNTPTPHSPPRPDAGFIVTVRPAYCRARMTTRRPTLEAALATARHWMALGATTVISPAPANDPRTGLVLIRRTS